MLLGCCGCCVQGWLDCAALCVVRCGGCGSVLQVAWALCAFKQHAVNAHRCNIAHSNNLWHFVLWSLLTLPLPPDMYNHARFHKKKLRNTQSNIRPTPDIHKFLSEANKAAAVAAAARAAAERKAAGLQQQQYGGGGGGGAAGGGVGRVSVTCVRLFQGS